MTLSDPPDGDTVEVSLFGPGVGECVLVHIGDGEWLVVDSCRDNSGTNAALDYFGRIGVDPGAAVRWVVATHAHMDHIAGISEILEASNDAKFVVPAAASYEEFFALVEFEEELGVRPEAYKEFRRAWEIVQQRPVSSGTPYHYATEGRLVFDRPHSNPDYHATGLALAPSDAAITRSRAAFAAWKPVAGDRPRRLASEDPNTFSIALWITVGEIRILLGGDLLVGPGLHCGWNGVLAAGHTVDQASVFKVAHHGAPNGHHDRVWDELLISDPWAIVAPFRKGRKPRPSDDDVNRICSVTRNGYITSKPEFVASKAARSAALALSDVARGVTELRGKMGQVRLRTQVADATGWSVTLDPPARSLCS